MRRSRGCISATPTVMAAISPILSSARNVPAANSPRRRKSSVRTSPRWACDFTLVRCFRRNIKTRSSSLNMAHGIAARRSAIASPLCSYKVTEPYRTKLSPKDGCKEAELGAGPSMWSLCPTAPCSSPMMKPELSIELLTKSDDRDDCLNSSVPLKSATKTATAGGGAGYGRDLFL